MSTTEPAIGTVTQIEHSPSGVFDLFLDSYGRLLFTKWDHLKRDQEADADRFDGAGYGSVDFESETSSTVKKYSQYDSNGKLIADSRGVLYFTFPEARRGDDPTRDTNEAFHDYNQFFIWQINEDGSNEETLNHVGRHEFGGSYMLGVFLDDPNLTDKFPSYIANVAMRNTFRADAGLFQLKEDINRPGTYIATYALEFARYASGRIVEFAMPPGTNPETVAMKDYTNSTLDADPAGTGTKLASYTGHYRNPLPLADGSILVSHTSEYRLSTSDHPYLFQLKKLIANTGSTDMIASASLTGGISKNVLWWTDAATPAQYNGLLHEIDAIEVRPRARPVGLSMSNSFSAIEKGVMAQEGVDEKELRAWLKSKNLALIVSRNLTKRDRADVQQPYNLRVPNGVQTIPKSGKVYDISALQIFQGDLTRGYGNGKSAGRRVFPRPLHNNTKHPDVESWLSTSAPVTGAVKIGLDGSSAAFVPAGRALSWQMVSPTGKPVVRERIWVSFAPGEIKTCPGCHGINSQTQAGDTVPTNEPQALRDLLQAWKAKK